MNSGRFLGASQAPVSLEQGPEQLLESGSRGADAIRLSPTWRWGAWGAGLSRPALAPALPVDEAFLQIHLPNRF